MHQVDMDLEWPMIDIPQELREMQDGEEDFNTRSNSQANAIRVSMILLDWREGLFSFFLFVLMLFSAPV